MEPKIVGIRIHMMASPIPESDPMRPTLRSWTAPKAAVPFFSSIASPAPRRIPATGGVTLKYFAEFVRESLYAASSSR